MAIDPEFIADALGIDIPECYGEFVSQLDSAADLEGILGDSVSTDPEQVIWCNEGLRAAVPVAGLEEWPDDYFVIGEDGCGNYYAIDAADDSVLWYDHEADEVSRIASSLEDFATRIKFNRPLDTDVIHSGYESRRERARLQIHAPTQITFSDDAPPWSRDWMEFVKTFVSIADKKRIDHCTQRRVWQSPRLLGRQTYRH